MEGTTIQPIEHYISTQTKQRVMLNEAGRAMVDKFIRDVGTMQGVQDMTGRSSTALTKLKRAGYSHPLVFEDVYRYAVEFYAKQEAEA